jgi:hypothetical protein
LEFKEPAVEAFSDPPKLSLVLDILCVLLIYPDSVTSKVKTSFQSALILKSLVSIFLSNSSAAADICGEDGIRS